MDLSERQQYDRFISYSSEDEREAGTVQKFLERYKHHRGVFPPAKRLRIRAFRDKSDQGLASDFLTTFESRIESTPSFLLMGSRSAFRSSHVRDECRCFLDTWRS
jgi:hypothetical protein